MKNVLRMEPVIYFDLEKDETKEEAEERLFEILNDVGLMPVSYRSEIVEFDE